MNFNFELRRIQSEAKSIAWRQAIDHDMSYEEFNQLCDNLQVDLLKKSFLSAIAPLQKMKVNIFRLAMPGMVTGIVIHEDGRFERIGDGLTDDLRDQVVKIDAEIANIAEMYKNPSVVE